MEELAGKVAVVTGGASGIGLALATRFAEEGMKVVVADIQEDALTAATEDLRAAGHDVRSFVCDVSREADNADLAASAKEEFGAVHIVCLNAGVGAGGQLATLSVKDWEWCLGVNLWGVIHGVRAFLPGLLEQGEGHIVNTASVAGLFSAPFMGPYNVSKFGVVALSETLYHELAMSGTDVGVSVLCPSWVSTNIHDSERNRPDHLRDESDGGDDGAAAGLREILRGVIESGMPTSDVADQVVAAVRAKQFYVLTHPDSAAAVAARAKAITGQQPPPFFMPQ